MTTKKRNEESLDFLTESLSFGDYFRAERERLEMTQAELAEKLGFSSGEYISQIERGDRLPKIEKIKRLAEVMGCPIEDYLNVYFTELANSVMDETNLKITVSVA